jgi:hypothetical protein
MARAIVMSVGVLFIATLLALGEKAQGMSEWVVTIKTEDPRLSP